MEDARYRTRQYVEATSSVDLVAGSAGDTVLTYRVKHPKIEVVLLGCHFPSGVTGPVAEGNEAILGLYNDPTGGGAVVDMESRLTVPPEGAPTQSDIVAETNRRGPDRELVNDWPTFVRGDIVTIRLVQDGATTAQAGFPWFCFREVKFGPQEGPS